MNSIKELEKKIFTFVKKNLKGYEFAYITSDLRGFIQKYDTKKPEKICEIILDTFLRCNLTLIVPTYSYTSKGKFNIKDRNSNLGFFTKWFLTKKNIIRSEHPIFSVAAIGKSSSIAKNIGKSAFGNESIFFRLLKKKSSLFHFGRPFEFGNTVIHYVEQSVEAPYRKIKFFKTKVYRNTKYIGQNYSIFARIGSLKSKKFFSNTKKIDILIKKKNLIKKNGNENN